MARRAAHPGQSNAPRGAGDVRTGRGAMSNPVGRFEKQTHESFDDGWEIPEEEHGLATTLSVDTSRTIIARNKSPDVPFLQSINPYRGCEHGCIYCFARPSHSYLGLSAGLDFETRLFYKPDAAALLRRELARPGYRCSPITLGANTDCYQPAERKLGITRELLEVLLEHRHPVSIITKSTLIARDLDLLADMARDNLAEVFISLTSLDPEIKRTLEPRAASPGARLRTIRALADAGVPVGTLVAPVIPVITDWEMERLLDSACTHGAQRAGYVLLRLPHDVRGLFTEWLQGHAPGKAQHVLSLLRQSHGGKEYDPQFGKRMRGQGQYAEMLAQRFRLACRKYGFNRRDGTLDTARFQRPARQGDQLSLL